MADLNRRIGNQELTIALDETAKSKIIDDGYEPAFGARPLKRYLQKHVETLAARLILKGDIHEGAQIRIGVRDGELYAYTAEKP